MGIREGKGRGKALEKGRLGTGREFWKGTKQKGKGWEGSKGRKQEREGSKED